MKNSQFPNTHFGNAIKNMVESNEPIYREYITEDYPYSQACEIPQAVAEQWLRSSVAFQSGLLTWYLIGAAADSSENAIRWMNKGVFRVDDGNSLYGETWLYKHDFTYYVVVPNKP